MTTFATETERWRAVQLRNPKAASAFVYAVKTTKIFCRPTCPARLARRANVLFFDKTTDARDAGFRACLRCKPELPLQHDPSSPAGLNADAGCGSMAGPAVSKAKAFIEAKHGHVTLADVAAHVGLSPRYVHGIFKEAVGVTPSAFAARCQTMAMMAAQASPQNVEYANQFCFAAPTDVQDNSLTPDSEYWASVATSSIGPTPPLPFSDTTSPSLDMEEVDWTLFPQTPSNGVLEDEHLAAIFKQQPGATDGNVAAAEDWDFSDFLHVPGV